MTAPLLPTPSQTAGPFVSIGTEWLTPEGTAGPEDVVVITGVVRDGAGAPVTDAMLEFWQAPAGGGHLGVGARGSSAAGAGGSPAAGAVLRGGFSRALTDGEGRYRLVARKPLEAAHNEAPHVDVSIFARGLLQRLVTRIYFPGQASNASDPVLAQLGDELRGRLIARLGASEGGSGTSSPAPVYHFNINLQGDEETVFFATW